jgi:tetratricopeptide (TPR) repeat protein/CHAT domain-containing protein
MLLKLRACAPSRVSMPALSRARKSSSRVEILRRGVGLLPQSHCLLTLDFRLVGGCGGTYVMTEGWARWCATIAALTFSLWLQTAHAQEQPPELAAIYQQGLALYEAGKYAEAIPVAEEYISVAGARYGKEHPLYAAGLGYLGVLYLAIHRNSEAETLFAQAVEIKKRAGGPPDPRIGEAINDLAERYHKQRQYAEAEALYKLALSVTEKEVGPEHPATGIVLNNLAELYRAQGRHSEAAPLAQRAAELSKKSRDAVRGPQSDEPDDILSQVVPLLRAGRYGEAIPLVERYSKIIASRHGTEGPEYKRALSLLGATLNKMAGTYYTQGRYKEAEPYYERVLAIDEKVLGADHPTVAISLSNLAELYRTQGRHAEAEPLIKRSLSILELAFGTEHPKIAISVNNLAGLYYAQGRYAEAEPLFKRSLAIREKALGPDNPDLGVTLNNLAELYRTQGKYGQAEPLFKRSLAIREKALGPDNPDLGLSLHNLAGLYREQGRYAEAEPLFKRSLAIYEKALGPDHPDVGNSLNNLGLLFVNEGRFAEAEPLFKRSIGIYERAHGHSHAILSGPLLNLAEIYDKQGNFRDAEPLLRRAFDILEKVLGPNHPNVASALGRLGWLYAKLGRYVEAQSVCERSVAIYEQALGPDHPNVGSSLNRLGLIYLMQRRYADAEPLFKRALAIKEGAMDAEHPEVGITLNNLAGLNFDQGNWALAANFWRRSTSIIVHRTERGGENLGQAVIGKRKGEAEQSSSQFVGLLKAVHRLALEGSAVDRSLADEMFRTAQWAVASEAAASVAQMAARQTKSDDALSRLVRERQDLVAEWRARDKLLSESRAQPPDKRSHGVDMALLARLAAIDERVAGIDRALIKDFPDYATFASPQPLAIAEVQASLNGDEALLLFLDTPNFNQVHEETFVWVVTKTNMRWVTSDLGTKSLIERVVALRCGLDRASWEGESSSRCANLLAIDLNQVPRDNQSLPFDLSRAHQLYQALFGQVEDLIKGKHLLIVPSGPLTQLPFHVLVTEQPDPVVTGNEAFRRVAWLAKSNAITVLPAVSSLKALREYAKASRASKPFVGFGNPLLTGRDANDGQRAELARARQHCAQSPLPRVGRIAGGGMNMPQQRGGLVELADIRAQVPLPETADELCTVARSLGVPESEVWLGSRANERELKRLSDNGDLAAHRIVHFATHGVLAGELNGGAEPGLILTPPSEATAEDDGYLSASEVAGLKLDADWVILSACNTAAAGTESAEALSGLSRTFFYAGARALLVSHWAVNSDVTVKLITKTLSLMAADKTIARSEALRRSMVALIEQGEPYEAHPAYWAPFVVVGEGSLAEVANAQTNEPAAPAKKASPKPRIKKQVNGPAEIWLKPAN